MPHSIAGQDELKRAFPPGCHVSIMTDQCWSWNYDFHPTFSFSWCSFCPVRRGCLPLVRKSQKTQRKRQKWPAVLGSSGLCEELLMCTNTTHLSWKLSKCETQAVVGTGTGFISVKRRDISLMDFQPVFASLSYKLSLSLCCFLMKSGFIGLHQCQCLAVNAQFSVCFYIEFLN